MINNIKPINKLLGKEFFIPSFQRGYRWGEREVQYLLEDIWEFYNIPKKEEGEFYCLQPVVVKKEGNKYRLIDGQQRLTTIYLILSYLDFYMKRYKYKSLILEYETRQDSQSFLQNIQDIEKVNDTNVDYYYMSKAYLFIKDWFEKYPEREIDFFNTLVKINLNENDEDLANNVRVIWYEISNTEDEIDVFTRINSGKIPLTNAELIKALFLNSKNFGNEEKNIKQIEISKEWDEIEYTLQNDELWSFIVKEQDYPTRIELIFNLLSYSDKKDDYATYRYFTEQKNIVDLWSKEDNNVKKIFLSLKYFFEDRTIYHLIGYLISEGIKTIDEIYNDFKLNTKTNFIKILYKYIQDNIKLDDIENLEYEPHDKDIKKILLLFNIATILNNKDSYIRFSFDKFNQEKWSLEHIHAQNDRGLTSKEAKISWLIETKQQIDKLENISYNELLKEINTMIELEKIEDEEFNNLQSKTIRLFGDEDIDTIDNLALLNVGVNSALSNSIFPIKRQILKQKDSQGEFIPICTKNVFLKYYSDDVKNIYYWSKNDRKAYLKAIKNTLNKFMEIGNE